MILKETIYPKHIILHAKKSVDILDLENTEQIDHLALSAGSV